ncbi:MAG: DUF1848 domain-containing protein [Butyrivibrio sp.]|nr:DUF1848 domain-containing protein [Butyrivibrio sp.]
MLISASRRTDIPSYYSEWFFNRLKEEYVLVRNPMNPHQVSRIDLSPKVVDGIVFWTKNPAPMLSGLDALEKYPYYFQFTLNAYGSDAEAGLPSKEEKLIPLFCRLSKEIGRERVVWRYDPVFLNEKYTAEYHLKYFEALASRLAPFTEKCIISFLDLYRNIKNNIKPLHIYPPDEERQYELMAGFARTAQKYGICLDTCAEEKDFGGLGVRRAHCIDRERLEKIGGFELNIDADRNQRKLCGCAMAVDIGAYNTCRNGCVYCYANHSRASLERNHSRHNPKSPLLFGELNEGDTVKERSVKSFRIR